MRRLDSLLIALLLTCITTPALAGKSDLLVGRWQSDTAETGYWIIERFANGRFARKQYADHDSLQPAEIEMSWGRWKLQGNRYSQVLEGSTSAFFQKFIGERLVLQVEQVGQERFAFWTHDEALREERRQPGEQPLASVKIVPPTDAQRKRIVDTVTPVLNLLPAWAKDAASSDQPNHSFQRTSGR